jgi:hypothetical protein
MARSEGVFHAVPSGSIYWDLLAEWVQSDPHIDALRTTNLCVHTLPPHFTPLTPHVPPHRLLRFSSTLRHLTCSRFSLIARRAAVIGTKTFHVLPPEAERFLDISPRPPHTNTSQIPISIAALFGSTSPPTAGHRAPPESDLDAETLSRYRAALVEAFKLPGACEARLGPGESLLVPEGWWHSAEGVETGVGINAWFR